MKLSIIIPVYHEEKNIEPTLQKVEKLINTPHETLIVYNSIEDPTYPVAKAYIQRHKKNSVSLVKNNVGNNRGVINAIKTGFSRSRGDAVVVVMADLSDDLSQVDEMFELFKRGYDIICGSRYMKGGRKIGGPRLKTFLSRAAGLTLYYFFRIPTHDATNAFKLYNRKIFKKITIESTGGFEYSLEIILKAHALGYSITEIPTTWTDRTAGKSNFKLRSWLPKYAKWYFRAYWLSLMKLSGHQGLRKDHEK